MEQTSAASSGTPQPQPSVTTGNAGDGHNLNPHQDDHTEDGEIEEEANEPFTGLTAEQLDELGYTPEYITAQHTVLTPVLFTDFLLKVRLNRARRMKESSQETDLADIQKQADMNAKLTALETQLLQNSQKPIKTTMVSTAVYLLGTNCTSATVNLFCKSIEAEDRDGHTVNYESRVDDVAAQLIALKLRACNKLAQMTDDRDWTRWTSASIVRALRFCFPADTTRRTNTLVDAFQKVGFAFHPTNNDHTSTYIGKVLTIQANCFAQGVPKEDDQLPGVKVLLNNIIRPPDNTTATGPSKSLHTDLHSGGIPKTVTAYCEKLTEITQRVYNGMIANQRYMDNPAGADQTSNKRSNQDSKSTDHRTSAGSNNQANKKQSTSTTFYCKGCGTANKHRESCDCLGHPDRNTSKLPFNKSTQYQDLKKRLPNVAHPTLSFTKHLDGTDLSAKELKAMAEAKAKILGTNLPLLPPLQIVSFINDNRITTKYFVQCYVSTNDSNCLPVNVLVDTGALQGNYVSPTVADWLDKQDLVGKPLCIISKKEARKINSVNLAGTNISTQTLGIRSFNVKFFNEINKTCETLSCLRYTILPSNFDLIIGLPAIRKHHLTIKLPSFFGSVLDSAASESEYAPAPAQLNSSNCGCGYRDSLSLSSLANCIPCRDNEIQLHAPTRFIARDSPKAIHQLCIIAQKRKQDLLDFVSDTDDITYKENPFEYSPETASLTSDQLIEKVQFNGTIDLQARIKNTCMEFSDIFSESVRPEPADVPPMDLVVDWDTWRTNKNRGPPRPQTKEKQAEVYKQVNAYLKLNVVETSTASEYSQVHLVPKPTPPGEPTNWRFCIDYVRFNHSTIGVEGNTIPNVSQMLQRVGEKKPKVFGVMDMTSGYHQAPLSMSARILTAFICFMGVLQWLRVPMGLKNAAAYFQRVMATVVLVGLIYICCELYIDDVLVFGANNDEFITNLRLVFERFRKHKITLNPKKCKFGMDHVEYVGHVISEDGLSFTEKKREKVLNFPPPTRQKEMLAFLGLVNYFRDHVPDMTSLLHELRSLVLDYDKRKPIQWTPALEQTFYKVRDTIGNCPDLYFPDDNYPIIVRTDASDFGMGGYGYQVIDGKEKPLFFFSKSFINAQKNWTTIEKECYAIVYVCAKFEHLLQGRKFLLQTDHKNLTYINLQGSQKIRRWKMFLQDFDFDIEHIPGKTNTVADHFSRLCLIWDDDMDDIELQHLLASQVMSEYLNFISPLFNEPRIRIPDIEYKIIGANHNSTVGHFGVEKTILRLHNQNKNWKNLRAHVRQFIRQCPLCQKLSNIKLSIHTHPFTTASYNPMEVLNIDSIGPLTTDKFGNCYILVIIDCFSRWVELFPLPDTSALGAARALLAHTQRYGVPAFVRSDRGSQFVNEILSDLCKLLGTEQEFTTAYSHEENSIVERNNAEVMRHLRAILFDKRIHDTWSMDDLPKVMRIENSEINQSTGVSPADLLFGGSIDLGRRLLHPVDSSTNQPIPNLSEYMDSQLKRQALLIEVAQQHQLKKDTHHMSGFDPDFTEFPINSYVLVTHPRGKRPKLLTTKEGPYQVINFVGSKYTLQDLLTGKNFDIHVSNLSPFNYDTTRTDPKDVAMHDQGEFLIRTILAHRGDKTRRKTMEFLVSWVNLPAEENSWEPYASLRDTDQLLEYLRTHKMKSLISTKHK